MASNHLGSDAYQMTKAIYDIKRANGIDAAMAYAKAKWGIEDAATPHRESIRDQLEWLP